MAATQYGTDLIIGVGSTLGNYVIIEHRVNDDEVTASPDVRDEDGTLKTRVILQIMDRQSWTLVPLSGATPGTDFPKGGFCAISALSNLYCEASNFIRTQDPARVEVTLINLGIT